jgi:hypothetical protein
MLQRLRSAVHALALARSERAARVRGPRPERPAGTIDVAPGTRARIDALQHRYGVAFERSMGERAALAAYEYLGWLDEAFEGWRVPAPRLAARDVPDVVLSRWTARRER